ncbi:hypothetical protein RND71_039769 [Anisodus tanguticus]|uniref:RRM domain-containing protein n=1 Tax=Anisodus tanguticus TaxID=243964 RepID=A0AAE1QXZ9_9SOLA|nr:hypothetical protein RND71_039769 [Anisodus tanguticus]
MAENPNCTVYVGNLDERVSYRVLYDILIQAGRVVDVYIPRDKETDKPKGFAFAKYETEEIADYAVKLFSGLVTLYNRTLKFAISGKDKPSNNSSMATPPTLNIPSRPRPHPVPYNDKEISPNSVRLSNSCRFSEHQTSYTQVLSLKDIQNVPNRHLVFSCCVKLKGRTSDREIELTIA